VAPYPYLVVVVVVLVVVVVVVLVVVVVIVGRSASPRWAERNRVANGATRAVSPA